MVFSSIRRFITVSREDGFLTAIDRTKAYLGIQATILKQTYFSRPIGEKRVRKNILGSQMDLNVESSQVARQLAETGMKERGSITAYQDLLGSLRDDNETVYVVDIGANIGYFTLTAANVLGPTGRIFAFEPGPRNYSQLKNNIELNNYSQINTKQVAIGSERSIMELQLIGDSNIHQMAEINPGTGKKTIEVDVHTLDEFVESEGIPIDAPLVIKMDVEGYEGEVFEGMTDLLKSDRPIYILVELHPIDDDPRDKILNALKTNGFEIEMASYNGGQTMKKGTTYDEIRRLNSNTHILAQRDR